MNVFFGHPLEGQLKAAGELCVPFWSPSRWSAERVTKCSIRDVLEQEEGLQHSAPCPCVDFSKVLNGREAMNLP
jgi:hypothetical protein